MNKTVTLTLVVTLTTLKLFCSSPGLIWHTTYGASAYNQRVLVMAIDNYDNMFAAGYVNFGSSGNILINRYDGVGNLKWNRTYNNPYNSGTTDKPVAVFPDNVTGVTVVGYVNTQAVMTHILHYNASGYLTSDLVVGDSTAGSQTIPVAVIYDGASSFYMIGQLNNVSKIFKCNNNGNIVWSAPLHNAFNNQAGSINFDPNGNIIAAVFDSVLPQVVIRRYNANSGSEMPGFNTGIDSLPVNGNPIKIGVDQSSNIFLAGTAMDSLGRVQLVAYKFDTSGTPLWSTICNSSKGHSNQVNSFLLDHDGNVLISGPYIDYTDTLQFGAVYKLSNADGSVIWSAIDSQFLVNNAVTQVDQFNYVYLGTTKTPSTISPEYSNFSFSKLSPDSGFVSWNRSFDNSADNTGLIMRVNNFGDVFFVTNSPTDSSSSWFLGRIGNNAGDSTGTAVQNIEMNYGLSVFPNPFSSVTTVSFTTLQAEVLSVKLYDITGQVLQQQEIQSVSGLNSFTLKTIVASGVYLLKLQGPNSFAVRQVAIN